MNSDEIQFSFGTSCLDTTGCFWVQSLTINMRRGAIGVGMSQRRAKRRNLYALNYLAPYHDLHTATVC